MSAYDVFLIVLAICLAPIAALLLIWMALNALTLGLLLVVAVGQGVWTAVRRSQGWKA